MGAVVIDIRTRQERASAAPEPTPTNLVFVSGDITTATLTRNDLSHYATLHLTSDAEKVDSFISLCATSIKNSSLNIMSAAGRDAALRTLGRVADEIRNFGKKTDE